MNYGDALFHRNEAEMRFLDTYLQCPTPYDDAPAANAICTVCGQQLVAGDWQYIRRAGCRRFDCGCSECCAIGVTGALYDTRSGEDLAQAGDFDLRIVGEEGAA